MSRVAVDLSVALLYINKVGFTDPSAVGPIRSCLRDKFLPTVGPRSLWKRTAKGAGSPSDGRLSEALYALKCYNEEPTPDLSHIGVVQGLRFVKSEVLSYSGTSRWFKIRAPERTSS